MLGDSPAGECDVCLPHGRRAERLRPYDSRHPVVCFDETSKQLVKETQVLLPIEPGQPPRYDCEYERNGVSNLFMFVEPLAGWRQVEVTERRTKRDYAQQMKYLVDVRYPDAE